MTLPSIEKIDKEVAYLLAKKKAIQERCLHVSVVKTPNSDIGNWCRGDDSYWYDCHCPRCDKRWMEEQ